MKHIFYSLIFISSVAHAQELVKDVNKTPASQVPFPCYACGDKVYFIAGDGIHGRELWMTDGTEGGTNMVKDIVDGLESGIGSSNPQCSNNKMYFGGRSVWRTDGTETGTTEVFGYPGYFAVFDDKVLVISNDGIAYSVNGDGSNPLQIKDLKAIEHEGTLNVRWVRATSNGIHIITSYNTDSFDNVGNQWLFWDGSSLITLMDLGESEGSLSLVLAVEDKLLVSRYSEESQPSIWVSDGTAVGTTLLLDQAEIPFEQEQVTIDGRVILMGRGLNYGTWLTDGTVEGTERIIEDRVARAGVKVEDYVYFITASNDDYQNLITKTNAQYEFIAEITPDSDYDNQLLGEVNGKFLFAAAFTEKGIELQSTDGETTTLVKDINVGFDGSNPRSFAKLGSGAVFMANDGTHGFELWKTDGTAEGTSLVKDIAFGTEGTGSDNVYYFDNKIYFKATADTLNSLSAHIWESDGTSKGTRLIDASALPYGFFSGVGKYVVTGGFYKTNTETLETSLLYDYTQDYGGGGGLLFFKGKAVGDDLYFYQYFTNKLGQNETGTELYRVNPATNEFTITKDINPGIGGSQYEPDVEGSALNGKLIFGALSTDGVQPWITDGTPAGTTQLKQINGTFGSYPNAFITVGNNVFFVAYTQDTGIQLWKTDGTTAGTVMVSNPSQGTVISSDIAALGTKVVVGVSNGTDVAELWTLDGGSSNKIADLPSPTTSLSNFTSIGDKVLFVKNNKTLWVTDGTADGTKMLNYNVVSQLKPHSITVSNGSMYFYNEGDIWRTFGTSVEKVGPANLSYDGSSFLTDFYVTDNYVLFFQNDPVYGRELFRYELSGITGLVSEEKESPVIYPNPTNNVLFVKVVAPTQIRVTDMSGREKYSQFVSGDTSIDVSLFADGVYVVILNNERLKFVKRH